MFIRLSAAFSHCHHLHPVSKYDFFFRRPKYILINSFKMIKDNSNPNSIRLSTCHPPTHPLPSPPPRTQSNSKSPQEPREIFRSLSSLLAGRLTRVISLILPHRAVCLSRLWYFRQGNVKGQNVSELSSSGVSRI